MNKRSIKRNNVKAQCQHNSFLNLPSTDKHTLRKELKKKLLCLLILSESLCTPPPHDLSA